MGALVSAQTKRAIRYHTEGLPVYAAAKKAGIAPSTLYRAIERAKAAKPAQPKEK